MSASMHRRGCLKLGICQDRPSCSECTRLHSSEGHQSALRIERLINSRHQHTVYEPMPKGRKAVKSPVDPENPNLRSDPGSRGLRPLGLFVGGPVLVSLALLAVHVLAR